MIYKDVKEVIPVNGFVVIEQTEESKDAINGTGSQLSKTNSLLKKTPIAQLISKASDCTVDAQEDDFIIYRAMTEVGAFLLGEEKRNLTFIHESNLIAKLK